MTQANVKDVMKVVPTGRTMAIIVEEIRLVVLVLRVILSEMLAVEVPLAHHRHHHALAVTGRMERAGQGDAQMGITLNTDHALPVAAKQANAAFFLRAAW